MTKKPRKSSEPEMKMFKCTNCSQKYPDWQSYFYGASSKKCIACMKNPKRLLKKRVFK